MATASAKQLAHKFIEAAKSKSDPRQRRFIIGKAADVFTALARDPSNVGKAPHLEAIAAQFRAAQPATYDDFDQLVRETAEAYEQAGGEGLDRAPPRESRGARRVANVHHAALDRRGLDARSAGDDQVPADSG